MVWEDQYPFAFAALSFMMPVVVAEDLEHGEVQCAVAGAVMELAYAIAGSGVMLVAKGGF